MSSVKYDFILAPYADHTQIVLEYSGAEQLTLENGRLIVRTSVGEVIEQKPIAFQWIDGKKIAVACEYLLEGNQLSFCFPLGYDPCYELTIDPLLIFSTYSGSVADNWGSTATPAENGNLYSAGVTSHVNAGGSFPATPGAFQTTYGGLYDIGILKYDSAGKRLLYATYLGGDNSESPHSLVVNAKNELIVLGTTSSFNFPTSVNAIDRTLQWRRQRYPRRSVCQWLGYFCCSFKPGRSKVAELHIFRRKSKRRIKSNLWSIDKKLWR